jgi:hypothetical protein
LVIFSLLFVCNIYKKIIIIQNKNKLSLSFKINNNLILEKGAKNKKSNGKFIDYFFSNLILSFNKIFSIK